MDGKYQCETCDKTYKSENYFNKHKCIPLKTSKSTIQHKCQFCDKSFSRLYYKNSHEEKCAENKNERVRNDFTPNNYGYENIEYISIEQVVVLISKRLEGVIKMILLKHFNQTHPENQNVVIVGDNYFVYRNDRWNKINRDALINDLYYDGINSIDTLYEEAFDNNKPMKVKDDDIEFLKYEYEDECILELNKKKIGEFLDTNKLVGKINKSNSKFVSDI